MEQIQQAQRRGEYAIAFRSIRAAKNLAATLIILCILGQIGATVAVHFVKVLDEPAAAAVPADKADDSDSSIDLEAIKLGLLEFGLPGMRFAALVLCLLLVLMIMFAVKLSLVERVGGVAGFISSFNWSLILLLMLVPWKPILDSSLSCGALFNFGELKAANSALGQSSDQIDQVLFYARFIAYPCLALLTCVIVQVKFARGYSAVDFGLDEGGQDPAPIAGVDSPIA